jgi:hypothetical protein
MEKTKEKWRRETERIDRFLDGLGAHVPYMLS